MTQIQLTTREAVQESIQALAYMHSTTLIPDKGKQRVLSAARLLCDLYGFKLAQFFGDGDEREKS